MTDRWLGVVVSGDRVTLVDAEVPDTGQLVIQADESWPLQQGDRIPAYVVMSQQISDYAKENNIALAVIKASAVSLGGTKKAHLDSAELRGVVMAALGAVTKVVSKSKGTISRTFGERKVDAYVADGNFWQKECTGKNLRNGSREAAMVLLAARKSK